MADAPAGWYDDGSGHRRYWNGSEWTNWYAQADGTPVEGVPTQTIVPTQTKLTHQDKKSLKLAAKAHEVATQQHAEWQQRYDLAQQLVREAQTNHGQADGPLMLKKDEFYFGSSPTSLVEDRAQRSYSAGYRGVSIPVASIHGHAVRYTVGRSAGSVHTSQVATIVDWGVLHVTNQRLIFVGAKATREHLFAKMISLEYEDNTHILISVSNRQKPTLLQYAINDARDLQVTIALAQSDATGKRDELVNELQQMLDGIKAQEPAAPVG
jgi:hypothetical protein